MCAKHSETLSFHTATSFDVSLEGSDIFWKLKPKSGGFVSTRDLYLTYEEYFIYKKYINIKNDVCYLHDFARMLHISIKATVFHQAIPPTNIFTKAVREK